MNGLFPEDSAERKTYPVYSGLLAYFPAALAAVAHHSYAGNEKHNPGQPLHHDRAKSGDEADALVRHLMEGDYVGMAWRALALLQKDCEAKGAPVAPAARNVTAVIKSGWREWPSNKPVDADDNSGSLNVGVVTSGWVEKPLAAPRPDDPSHPLLKPRNPPNPFTGD